MNKEAYRLTAAVLLTLATLLLLTSITMAQSGDGPSALLGTGYDLFWWTVDGGGGTFNTGGGYSLSGAIGQPDAALWQDETYTLIGGFWGGAAVESRLYLPLVLRSS